MDSQYIDRLTSALYRVTDRMDDAEPLKWKLRKLALEFSDLYFEKPEGLSFDAENRRTKNITSAIENITRLLQLAASLSYVARMNFDILLREYGNIKNELFPEPQGTLAEEITIPKKEPREVPKVSVQVKSIEPTMRQQKILEFLGNARKAGIAEMVTFFQETVSEKTLQRDLIELISKGHVEAQGERRWRIYSLPNKEQSL